MASVTIEELVKQYDDVTAVSNLNIDIADGEFVVLVGPSGCGKSTTLNSIAGLETPTSGRISLDDEEITDLRPQERDIAMVFQNYALYPHMTVEENIEFGLKMATDFSADERTERVRETAELLSIEDLLDNQPRELSGGQQQRVALGRAIVREPAVFLMDEPLSNLDAKLRSQMRTEIQQLQNALGTTTIYVTHDQTEAMTMGDRIAIMDGGELQQIATPLEVYHQPANRFVAGFIGEPSMNFFQVRKHIDGDEIILDHEQFSYEVITIGDALEHESKELTLGIRPNKVRLAESDERNVISVEANLVEPMGDTNHVYFELGDETCTMTVPGDELVREGTEIEVVFPEDSLHVFDTKSGDAIVNPESGLDEDQFAAPGISS